MSATAEKLNAKLVEENAALTEANAELRRELQERPSWETVNHLAEMIADCERGIRSHEELYRMAREWLWWLW